MKSGRFIEITAPNGFKIYEHQSIAYHKLSEEEFCKLKEDVCRVATKEILSGITEDEIWTEVEEHVSMLGNYHGEHGDFEKQLDLILIKKTLVVER